MLLFDRDFARTGQIRQPVRLASGSIDVLGVIAFLNGVEGNQLVFLEGYRSYVSIPVVVTAVVATLLLDYLLCRRFMKVEVAGE